MMEKGERFPKKGLTRASRGESDEGERLVSVSTTLIERLASLRFRARAAHLGHRSDREAFALTYQFIEQGLEAALTRGLGELHLHHDERGEIIAFILYWFQGESWYGPPIQHCALDYEWREPEAIQWATRKLLELKGRFSEHFELDLDAKYAPLLGVTLAAGLGIDSVILIGEPEQALGSLEERFSPPEDLSHLGLELEPLQSRREVDALIALKRQYFGRNPQHCWFGAHPRYLESQRKSLLNAVQLTRRGGKPKLQGWVIRRQGIVLGGFSYDYREDDPVWGRLAGVDLIFDPRIQRKGAVKSCYRVLLRSMSERGVERFKGGTSQRAILALGETMGRRLFSWTLRKRSTFPPSHFNPYLPASLSSGTRRAALL